MRHELLDTNVIQAISNLVRAAGAAILEVYGRPGTVDVSSKGDDTPLTEADLAAHRVLEAGLVNLLAGVPVVSEEDEASLEHRRPSGSFWLIDPLDGTKEFIARNGQFTVNVALVRDGFPVLGFVYAPVLDELFVGGKGLGARREKAGALSRITVAERRQGSPLRVVASRSHMNDATRAYLARLGAHELVQAGSSLKFCRVAEGAADCYPRIGPTAEWDTAAAQAVLEAAGGVVHDLRGERLRCGKPVNRNEGFVASAWPMPVVEVP
ncbi:MAG: 3'(2'),5'-bisphosphate nucleotidase CysQ [Phycisphaerales bacterium]|jgi:3'(2'), 5'-bisphosphate nucleotidase